jgi:hypothetical protein
MKEVVENNCQFMNKGSDGICYWWQRTYLGAPGFEWGCVSPHRMQYLVFSKFKRLFNDSCIWCPEPFMDCKLAEVWQRATVKFEMG